MCSSFSWMVFCIRFSSILCALRVCCFVELAFLWIALIALLLSVCRHIFCLVGLIVIAKHIACSSVWVESLVVGALAEIARPISVQLMPIPFLLFSLSGRSIASSV